MNTVTGLQTALNHIESDKVTIRKAGQDALREIFNNRENLQVFQDTAKLNGGAGWIALFQSLFHTVVLEKKAVLRKPAAVVERRLAEAASLVRTTAERSVNLLPRRAFVALFTHLTTLLVHDGRIFERIAIDYIKALRTLLSYPPHLQHLDSKSWRVLMKICWTALLGEQVRLDDDDEEDSDCPSSVTPVHKAKDALSASVANELLTLVPILLSSPAAPLLQPAIEDADSNDSGAGYAILLKIHRYFNQQANHANVPLEILRALNMVLGELELNARINFQAASLKLFPQLVDLWIATGRSNLGLREHIMIAMRTMLPFITHDSIKDAEQKDAVREAMERIIDSIGKESRNRAAIRSMDLDSLRLVSVTTQAPLTERGPFELTGLTAGFEFDASQALSWATLEFYADCCFHTYMKSSVPSTPSASARKRQRTESSLDKVMSLTLGNDESTRRLSSQVLVFLLDKRWKDLAPDARDSLRLKFLELLDEDDSGLQSWSFVGLSALAQAEAVIAAEELSTRALPMTPAAVAARRRQEQSAWERVWTHAVRKTSFASTSRAACHAVDTIIKTRKVDNARGVKDISSLLRNVDIQGPPTVTDSACAFLVTAIETIRADAGLYSANLEDKIVDWFAKTYEVDGGSRIRNRMGSATSANLLELHGACCGFSRAAVADASVVEHLVDSPVVNRLIYESETKHLRQLVLFGVMPPDPQIKPRPVVLLDQSKDESDSLGFLEGRPRKLSDILQTAVQGALEDWTSKSLRPPPLTAVKLRKSLDAVVLLLAFQGAVQLNGLGPDIAGCITTAVKMLDTVLPHLGSLSESVAAQRLVWRGLTPLYSRLTLRQSPWPILLKPDQPSGIRKDILPEEKYASHIPEGHNHDPGPYDELLHLVWSREKTSEALSRLIEVGKATLEHLRPSVSGASTALVTYHDDDDFGPVINADTETMPQSSEAREAQRVTASLIKTLVDLRLRGPLLSRPDRRPTKDYGLFNILAEADPSYFPQLGLAVCDAILEGSLRLNPPAVELILSELHSRLQTYAFKRDAETIKFAIVFLTRTAYVWLAPEFEMTDLGIGTAKWVVGLASDGQMHSWQARLLTLLFIDEYLDYDPQYSMWLQLGDTDEADIAMGGHHESDWGPLEYVLSAVLDCDARVRFRAASSAAAIHYLPDLSADRKADAYYGLLPKQVTAVFNWDVFLTNLIWKLNTCIASGLLRSGTIFHLYEVAEFSLDQNDSNSNFLRYLQPGLEAVVHRLGLSSLQTFYLSHANVIVTQQLKEGQRPLGLPPSLYGCLSRKEFAHLCLDLVGPSTLATREHQNFFTALCEASDIPKQQALERCLPAAAAIAVTNSFWVAAQPGQLSSKATANAESVLELLPSPDDRTSREYMASHSEVIVASLFPLINLMESNAEIIAILGGFDDDGRTGQCYASLTDHDVEPGSPPVVLEPQYSFWAVLQGLIFLRARFQDTMSRRRMVFGALIKLVFAINSSYLVTEQRRYLRSLALLASLYPKEFQQPMVLQQFMHNMINLLPNQDNALMVLDLIRWGFDQLSMAKSVPDGLVDLLVMLSTMYTRLQSVPNLGKVAEGLTKIVRDRAKSWQESKDIAPAIEYAVVFWPPEWTKYFEDTYELGFIDLANTSARQAAMNPMALCKRLISKAREGDETANRDIFLSSTFWHLKKALTASQWDHSGVMAFLDLIYMSNGQVRAPDMQAIRTLAGRSQLSELGRRYKDPALILRITVIDKIVELTNADDYRLRTTAIEVLQTVLPVINQMSEQTKMPSHLSDLVTLLVPSTPTSGSSERQIDVILEETEGWVFKARSRDVWSKDLALLLCALAAKDDPFYRSLQPLLSAPDSATADFLPYLVQAVLTCGYDAHPDQTMHRAAALSNHFVQVLQYPTAATETLEAIISIVLHLRNFKPPYLTTELAYNHWLSVDPLILSEAAGKCGAFASSLLFLEMASDWDGGSGCDLSSTRVQKIMYDVYSNVEDPDGFYGIQNDDAMDSLLRRLDHEGQALQSLGYNLASVEATSGTRARQPLMSSMRNLHDLGFNQMAGAVMQSSRKSLGDSESDPFFLDLAWRMSDWDVPLTPDLAETPAGQFYLALRAVHRERDYSVAQQIVDKAIQSEMVRLETIGVERMTEVKNATLNLLCLRDVAKWLSEPVQQAVREGDFASGRLASFVDLSSSLDFNQAERLSATRLSLIRSARARESRTMFGDLMSTQAEGLVDLEISCQLRLSRLSRKELDLQAAVNAVMAVRQLEGSTPSERAADEFGQVLWAKGEHGLAIQHTRALYNAVKASPTSANQARSAVLLGRIANWTSSAKLKAAEDIRSSFRDAMKLAQRHQLDVVEQAQLAYDFAVFADRHYVALSKSPELERLTLVMDRKRVTLEKLDSMRSTPSSSRRKPEKDDLELEEERTAKEKMDRELLRYLCFTLESYASAIALSDQHDDSITRMVSVWLEHDGTEHAQRAFSTPLKAIPPHKFIFLSPQLAARLDRPKQLTTFNANLNELMLRLAQDHPFHVLYQIITLAQGSDYKKGDGAGRTAAAGEILAHIAADVERPLAQRAGKEMEAFATASVQWCNFDFEKRRITKPKGSAPAPVPAQCPLLAFKRLSIPVATAIPPVDLTKRYANVTTLERYRSSYKLAGGLHRPAIMNCYDSLGKEHTQLFKGDDEVRQDAVMEQVFEMTNRLLARDRRASARNLKFRTYTVVCLANRSGIIEFVGNTQAIGDWLKDAHNRYGKGTDVSPDTIRDALRKIQSKDPDSPKLVEAWKTNMARFHPVMRHFFTEKRREPLAWFQMRLNYSRSVAVTSMVGWMVGLGDRHCSNILIDKASGELVQIDFGIAFESGMKLRIPERVPFRLTNDIVDGLGITGVDGTFRQCSEHTLRVLRESAELILTVLEVFKHDPLYTWTSDATKMRRAGGGRSDVERGQDQADRVLARIRGKLGTELSTEYRVNQLIQEARDPEHLAKIFVVLAVRKMCGRRSDSVMSVPEVEKALTVDARIT